MGRDDDAIEREERRIGRRLDREDVERRACEVPALERLRERVLVDDAAARGVDESRALLHQAQLALPDQSLGLGCERQMDRDEVGLHE